MQVSPAPERSRLRVGTNNLCITKRDRLLLSELSRVRVATAPQLAPLAGFRSKSRVNERLLKLTRGRLLGRHFFGTISGGRKAAYVLPNTRLGRMLRPGHLEHQLAVTEVYVSLRAPPEGSSLHLSGFDLGVAPELHKEFHLIPDARLKLSDPSGARLYFLEVDRGTEALPVWRSKAERYLTLARSGRCDALLGHAHFRVLVVAHSCRRAESIAQAITPLTNRIFFLTGLEDIESEGVGASIWLRPGGSTCVPLI